MTRTGEHSTGSAGRPVGPDPGDALVAAFNSARDELISTLVYVVGNRDMAQDAAQEAFVKCWRNRHQIAEVENLRAWIFRVAMNAAKDLRRSAWSRKARGFSGEELFLPGRDGPPEDDLDDRDALIRIRAAIHELRPEEKEIFLLRQNGDLTFEEIADLRGAPIGTVKTQMRSALAKLKKILRPENGDDDSASRAT
jgi:RNA polymerase sigma-70 factor (ECF subfamily)